MFASVTLLVCLHGASNVVSSPFDGPDGVLSNFDFVVQNITRPSWYADVLSSANVLSEDGGISIVLDDGAIWLFGDMILSNHWISNGALRIWTSYANQTNTSQPNIKSVEFAKFSLSKRF